MDDSLLVELSSKPDKQPMISNTLPNSLLRWVRRIGTAIILCGFLLFATAFILSRFATVSGKVVSATTKAPIEGVFVYVHSGMPYEEDGLNTYAKTGADGGFSAQARGDVSVSAWKPGYARQGVAVGYTPTLFRQEIIIELRELTPTNLVTENDEFYHIKHGDGFSFKLGKVISGDSPDADIVVAQDTSDKTTISIEAPEEGGISFQPWDEKTDFDNSPEAPLSGYEKRLVYPQTTQGVYFVRTRDGKHYAKFMLLVGRAEPTHGSPFLDLESSRMIWAYQPDGTRSLEVAPGKNLSFPVERFGLKRESLGQ